MNKPLLIALCGYPKAGKTTVAEYLVSHHGAIMVDDGAILRQAAMALYGLSLDDVYSQEGKLKTITVCGQSFTHRQLCGHLGNLLEGFYGEQFVPEQTLRILGQDLTAPVYVFPSVRKAQGVSYHKAGGVVIEVARPGTSAENDFDRYNRDLIDWTLENTGTPEDLFGRVDEALAVLREGVFA